MFYFAVYKILNIYNIYKLQLGEFMHKYVNRYLPDNFDNYFFLNSDVHSYYTHSSNLCHLFSHNTSFLEYSAKRC